MKKLVKLSALSVFSLGFLSLGASPPCHDEVNGDYLEARNCDVWTGPCFSNSEINTTGEFATLGWSLQTGSRWLNQPLAGLKIAAAIRAEGTLSTAGEGKIRSIVYIDRRASEAQEKALIAMAKKLAGKYLDNIVAVHRAEIRFQAQPSGSTLEAPEVLKISTTPLTHCDKHCGNETVAYPSLAKTEKFVCAKTVDNFFKGKGLEARWSDPNKRSAVLGSFSL